MARIRTVAIIIVTTNSRRIPTDPWSCARTVKATPTPTDPPSIRERKRNVREGTERVRFIALRPMLATAPPRLAPRVLHSRPPASAIPERGIKRPVDGTAVLGTPAPRRRSSRHSADNQRVTGFSAVAGRLSRGMPPPQDATGQTSATAVKAEASCPENTEGNVPCSPTSISREPRSRRGLPLLEVGPGRRSRCNRVTLTSSASELAPVRWTPQIARQCGRSVSWANASGGRSRRCSKRRPSGSSGRAGSPCRASRGNSRSARNSHNSVARTGRCGWSATF
jgi:hypothetical protein